MKIKEGFLLREIAGSYIVVPVGSSLVDFNAMMTTNETGAFLWEQLQDKKDISELVALMCKEYDIDENTAKNDIDEFITVLQGANVLE